MDILFRVKNKSARRDSNPRPRPWQGRAPPTEPLAQRAGDGNRTHISSLEGWCSTTELHPHGFSSFKEVGVTGFEPATSWSQTRRSSQAEPHPEGILFFLLSQAFFALAL